MTEKAGLGGAALVALGLLACERERSVPAQAATGTATAVTHVSAPTASALLSALPSAAPLSWPAFEAPVIEAEFCPERVKALDEDACFVLPSERTKELVIYLHGIVPPTKTSVQKTNLAAVVANATERAGVAALLPRGTQGLAPKGYPGWWGWPTSTASYERDGAAEIAKLREKRSQLEALLGSKFERVYLAGSSSGAYFVAAIALFGGMPEIAGYGVLSGGAGYKTKAFDKVLKRPVYVGFGKNDSVAPSARALGRLLEGAGWPVRTGAHPVPHGAREIYLDEAFAFWRSAAM
jgi:predicted esterase